MKLNELHPAAGSVKGRKRKGRGQGSGNGKTAGKGHKGQKARSGASLTPGFEGGQMPIHRRLPKRGFHSKFPVNYEVFNVGHLEALGLDEISPETLKASGRISHRVGLVKILGEGEISKAMTVKAHKFSKSAEEKIKAAGGTVEVI